MWIYLSSGAGGAIFVDFWRILLGKLAILAAGLSAIRWHTCRRMVRTKFAARAIAPD